MSEIAGGPMKCRYVGQGNMLHLEITWTGSDDPPWYGRNGLQKHVVADVLKVAANVRGVCEVRQNLSSGMKLRVWVRFKVGRGGQRVRDALLSAVQDSVRSYM